MTAAEQADYLGWFPNLDVVQAVVTGERTFDYNCFAWTIGLTNTWSEAGTTITELDAFYAHHGFTRAAEGPIAAWGIFDTQMTHAGISGPGHGPRWESKEGSELRFQHDLDELDGSEYGRVLFFYRQTGSPSPEVEAMMKKIKRSQPVDTYLSASQRKKLSAIVTQIPANLRKAYASAFAAWKATWFRGSLGLSSNAATRRVREEYYPLIAFGPAIIPLVIESLADPSNFMALQLYDAIQTDARLLVQFDTDDVRILTGEQGRAREVVHLWLANV